MRSTIAAKLGTQSSAVLGLAGAILHPAFWQATLLSILLVASGVRSAAAEEEQIDGTGRKLHGEALRRVARNKNVRAACDAACEAGTGAREAFCREFIPGATPLRAACWKMVNESVHYCHSWCGWWF